MDRAVMGGLLGAHEGRAAPAQGAVGALFLSARACVTKGVVQAAGRTFLVRDEGALTSPERPACRHSRRTPLARNSPHVRSCPSARPADPPGRRSHVPIHSP